MKEFHVLSPDGLPIRPGAFTSEDQAAKFIAQWSKRFEPQGYYGTASGERIPIADLPGRLTRQEA